MINIVYGLLNKLTIYRLSLNMMTSEYFSIHIQLKQRRLNDTPQ